MREIEAQCVRAFGDVVLDLFAVFKRLDDRVNSAELY